jgi:protein-tyrosine phosphatase
MPRPRGNDDLAEDAAWLRSEGVSAVVSLLTATESAELGLLHEELVLKHEGMGFHSLPIRDRECPDDVARLEAMVAYAVAILGKGGAVAFHCRAGIGRAGLAASTVLLGLGCRADMILAQISRARGVEVPDTDEQRMWFQRYAARMPSAGR